MAIYLGTARLSNWTSGMMIYMGQFEMTAGTTTDFNSLIPASRGFVYKCKGDTITIDGVEYKENDLIMVSEDIETDSTADVEVIKLTQFDQNHMIYMGEYDIDATTTDFDGMLPCRTGFVYQLSGTAGQSYTIGGTTYSVGDWIAVTEVDDTATPAVTVKKISSEVKIDNKTIVKNDDGELKTALGGYYTKEKEFTVSGSFDYSTFEMARYIDADTGETSYGYVSPTTGNPSDAHHDAAIGDVFDTDLVIELNGVQWHGTCKKDSDSTMLLQPPIITENGSVLTRYYYISGQDKVGLLYDPATSSDKFVPFTSMKLYHVTAVVPAQVSYADNELIAVDEMTIERRNVFHNKELVSKSFIDVEDIDDVDVSSADDFRPSSIYRQTETTATRAQGMYYYDGTEWKSIGAGIEILRLD